jgi:hypothetical protein
MAVRIVFSLYPDLAPTISFGSTSNLTGELEIPKTAARFPWLPAELPGFLVVSQN